MKTILRLILIVCLFNKLSAQTTSVLFIGNSYTYVNDLPQTLHDLALSKGDSIIFDSSAPGGYTFQMHSVYATTIAKINLRQWDYVVLQEQSQMPSFPPAQVATDTYPYATRLDSMILANDNCTETIFYMTWGRENGDTSNCASYPPVCTYDGMQERLRESYLQMSLDNHATCSPVGSAWKIVRDNYPTINLYQTDQSHPTVNGTYLAACVFYASLFHKTPIGAAFPVGVLPADALVLQTIGGATVLDSLSLWQSTGDIPDASFNTTINGNNVQFNNTSFNATTYNWNFGDVSNSTQTNPSHIYSAFGHYVVSLTASTNCKSLMAFDTLQIINLAGISSIFQNNSVFIYPNPATNELRITNYELGIKEVKIYNSLGQLIINKQSSNEMKFQLDVSGFNAGLYNIILLDNDKMIANQNIVIAR